MRAIKGQPVTIVLALSTMLFALCFSAFAQQLKKTPRIGLLLSGFPSGAARRIQGFQQGIRELGYVEGKNMVIEYRYAEGKLEPLTAELVRLKVDIIVTDTSNATQAAKDATKTIPVVFTTANDPVGDDQVASLAHPGGNLTGLSILVLDLNAKRLDLLKETVAKISRVGFLTKIGPTIGEQRLGEQRFKDAEAAAKGLGLRLQIVGAKGEEDLESAFETAKRAGVQALLAHPSTFVAINRARIIELAIKNRLPVMYGSRESAEAGALMTRTGVPGKPKALPDAVVDAGRGQTWVSVAVAFAF